MVTHLHVSIYVEAPVFVLAGLGTNKSSCLFFLCKSAIHF